MEEVFVSRPAFTVGGYVESAGGLYFFYFERDPAGEFLAIHPDEYWWLDREFNDGQAYDDGLLYVEEIRLAAVTLSRDDGIYKIDGTSVTGNAYLCGHIDDEIARDKQ